MPEIEVSLSDDTHFQLERMIEEEFVTEEQAIEELLTAGLEAYRHEPTIDEERTGFGAQAEENLFDTGSDPGDQDSL